MQLYLDTFQTMFWEMDINMPTKLLQFQCSGWLDTNGMIYSQCWIYNELGKNWDTGWLGTNRVIYSQDWITNKLGKSWGSVMINRELHPQKEENWIKQREIASILKLQKGLNKKGALVEK